jgi:hypothetical protein
MTPPGRPCGGRARKVPTTIRHVDAAGRTYAPIGSRCRHQADKRGSNVLRPPSAYAGRILFLGAMMRFWFFTTQFLRGVPGYSPLQAGIAFLPMTVVNLAVAVAVPPAHPPGGQRAAKSGGPPRALRAGGRYVRYEPSCTALCPMMEDHRGGLGIDRAHEVAYGTAGRRIGRPILLCLAAMS